MKPLVELLHQIADMFPVTESAVGKPVTSAESKSLSETLNLLLKYEISALVSVGAGADDKDPDTVVVQASQPYRIGLPAKDYYEDKAVVKHYQDMLEETIELIHPKNTTTHTTWMKYTGFGNIAAGDSKHYAKEVVEFEKKLSAATPDAADQNDVTVSLLQPMERKSLISMTRNTIIQCLLRMQTSLPLRSTSRILLITCHLPISRQSVSLLCPPAT